MSLANLATAIEIVVVERLHADDRAEDFLAHDAHVAVGLGQHGRLDEIALVADDAAAGHDLRALLAAGLEEALHRSVLLLGDQRPELDGRIEAVADLDLAGLGDRCPRRPCRRRTCARTGASRRCSTGPGCRRWRRRCRRSRDRDRRRGRRSPATCRRARARRASDCRPPPVTMSLPTSVEPVKATLSTSGCLASAAPAVSPKPVTMLTTPSGMPASAISSPKRRRRERRLLGGLEHDRAARGERRRELPGRHHQREVPRDDLADDADRFAQGVGVPVARARHRDRLAVQAR